MSDDPHVLPCVNCGDCCIAVPCIYGEWNEDKTACAHLTPLLNFEETPRYLCGIHDEIIKDPSSHWCPAFGAGCCRSLFNQRRKRTVEYLTSGK